MLFPPTIIWVSYAIYPANTIAISPDIRLSIIGMRKKKFKIVPVVKVANAARRIFPDAVKSYLGFGWNANTVIARSADRVCILPKQTVRGLKREENVPTVTDWKKVNIPSKMKFNGLL